jgi:hypothetical protein
VVSNYLCALAGLHLAVAHDLRVRARRRIAAAIAQDQPEVSSRPARRSGSGAGLLHPRLFAGFDARAYIILASGCAVFLYVSYAMPIGAGILAEGKSWNKKGPFDLGVWSEAVAALAVIGALILAFVGFQPPYQLVGQFLAVAVVVLIVVWFRVRAQALPWPAADRRGGKGPPGRDCPRGSRAGQPCRISDESVINSWGRSSERPFSFALLRLDDPQAATTDLNLFAVVGRDRNTC